MQRTRTLPAASAASSPSAELATLQLSSEPLATMSAKATLAPATLVFRSSTILNSPAPATSSGPRFCVVIVNWMVWPTRGVAGVTVLVVAATSMRGSTISAAASDVVPDRMALGELTLAVLVSVPAAKGRCTE